MKMSYNANGLRCMDPVRSIREVKRFGYDGIELSFHANHISPNYIDYKLLNNIKNQLEISNLKIASIATGNAELLSEELFEPSLIHPLETGRKRRMDMLRNCIEIAEYLECPILSFASGFLKPEMPSLDAYNYLKGEICEMLEISDKVILAIEPEPDMFIGTTQSAISLINDINNSRFRLNLDIGHVNVCEENYLKRIEEALPYSVHIHIEDIKDRIHSHLLPGDGDIDFISIGNLLGKCDYSGYVSVELYNHNEVWESALERSMSFLREL